MLFSLIFALGVFAGCSRGDDGPVSAPDFPLPTDDPGAEPRPAPSNDCDPRDPDDFERCAVGEDAGTEDAGIVVGPDVDTGTPDTPAPELGCPFWGGECVPRCLVAPRTVDPCATLETFSGETIREDTLWGGRFCVDGAIGVVSGATLTIEAGSEVYFLPGSLLATEGRIVALGTDAEPILLSASGTTPFPGAWQGVDVRLTEGGQVDLSNVIVEWASYGVGQWEHATDPTHAGSETNARLRRVTLRFNEVGIIVDDNTEVSQTTIVCNGLGIDVAAEDPDPGPPISDNNLCDNHYYDVRAGQDGAEMPNNYWCTTDIAMIEARTWDDRDDLSAGGLLELSPILTGPAGGAPPLP